MLNGDQLTVSSTGDSASEFNVTFSPIDNGRRLSVTRRVYVQGLSRPVVVQSVYDKTSDVARFTATVRQPSQYEGATIEGHVSNVQRSGRITGRSQMTLNFDNIRLRD